MNTTNKSRSWIPWLVIFCVVALCLFYLVWRPAKSHDALTPSTVSVSVRGIETNAITGEITAHVAVDNDGTQALEFAYGIQILTAQGWAHTNGNPKQFVSFMEDDPMLKSGSERLVSVARPSFGVPWRVVAVCWKPKSDTMPKGKSIEFDSPQMSP